MNKRKFDPEFESMMTNIRVASLAEESENRYSLAGIVGLALAVTLLVTTFAFTRDIGKIHGRVTALEQKVAEEQCRREAESVGAGYRFVAKGAQSECYPLYSD